MKKILSVRLAAGVAVLLIGYCPAHGGHPMPYEHPAELRKANLAMLKFQDALAAERWQEAISFCSDKVQDKAAKWSTLKSFFHETMPVEKILANPRFSCWTEQHNKSFHSYGLFVDLTEFGFQPVIQWNWSIFTKNGSWVIDFDPKPIVLEDLIAEKKAEIKRRQEQVERVRQTLEPKLRGVKTHLTPVNKRFIIGSPMLFRLELLNLGKEPVDFSDSGVSHESLILLNEKRQPVSYVERPCQIVIRRDQLAPGSSVVLADKIDLARQYDITTPGKYYVQFNGIDLDIGGYFIDRKTDPSGENEIFVPALSKFPSNVIEIEVVSENEKLQ